MQLYIGGLSSDTTELDIEEFFSKVYPVQSVTIIRDIESGKSKGLAIARPLKADNSRDTIKQLNGAILRGSKLTVRIMPETLPGEMEFREWLNDHASDVLRRIGIKEGHTVIDYGCGSGIFTIPCAKIVGKKGRIYALEVRSKMLEEVKQSAEGAKLSNIVTMLLDRSTLNTGLENNIANSILVYDVMHEIVDRIKLLQELHRLLKPSGFISIYPMHIGTDKMLQIMKDCSLFKFRDRYGTPNYMVSSEILNFSKC